MLSLIVVNGWFIFAEDIDAAARLITEDDDMMHNIKMPWWNPSYVRPDKKMDLVRCHCVFL